MQGGSLMSMYKIGNTTYYVETIFNPQAESLDELIERLIGKDIENILRQM
jgi:peptidoglycan hydrolase CwlO-like protein